MRSESEYRDALRLIEAGINDCEVARRLGIPRGTIRDWRVGLEARSGGRTKTWSGRRPRRRSGGCFRCNGERGVYRLRIACDLKYPVIVNEIATHMVIVRGHEAVGFTSKEGCVEVSSYWKHWPCLFSQHGPGRKHQRPIALAPWQESMVAAHPKAFIRGLIHSDGNRHINEVTRRFPSGTKHYRYPRCMFTNASTDILGLFTETLDLLEIHWTQTTPRIVSVARRDDVAFLDSFVGPKR